MKMVPFTNYQTKTSIFTYNRHSKDMFNIGLEKLNLVLNMINMKER